MDLCALRVFCGIDYNIDVLIFCVWKYVSHFVCLNLGHNEKIQSLFVD